MDEGISFLSSLKIGEKCVVRGLNAEGKERRRMLDLGLIRDTTVEAALKSPSGDPVAYYIRGALIALRSEDAAKVQINILS